MKSDKTDLKTESAKQESVKPQPDKVVKSDSVKNSTAQEEKSKAAGLKS